MDHIPIRVVSKDSRSLPSLAEMTEKPQSRMTEKHQCRYLSKAFTLDMGLDPFQPVRVLLLTHTLVHLGAQLLCTLQGQPEVTVIRVVLWSVL